MSFFLKKNKDSALIADIVSKIAVSTGVEKNVIYHFIAVDLEKIHQEKINVHSTRLKTLEDEFGTFDLIHNFDMFAFIDKSTNSTLLHKH